MIVRIGSSPWGRMVLGTAVLIGCCVAAARAGFPHPPFSPPPPVITPPPIIPPPIITPPPIDGPPPVHSAPEPATLAMGLIGSGIAGLAAYRKRKYAQAAAE